MKDDGTQLAFAPLTQSICNAVGLQDDCGKISIQQLALSFDLPTRAIQMQSSTDVYLSREGEQQCGLGI